MDLVLFSGAWWAALGSIILANIVLSGDNAVVIAMAARKLPDGQRQKAVFWGSAAAIVMRIVLTLIAVQLLQLPYLKIVGAFLLVYIGVQLMAEGDEDEAGDGHDGGKEGMMAAVRTILIADLVMSLDNVIAVAAAAKDNNTLLIIGLAVSIPLIVFGSTLLMKVMDRFPIIITLGAALLGFLAGEMFVTDPADKDFFDKLTDSHMWAGALGAITVVVIGLYARRHHAAQMAAARDKKRSAVPLYAAGVAVAGVIAVGAFMFTRSPAPPPAIPEAPATKPVAPPPQAVAPAAPAPHSPIPLDEAFAATVAGSDSAYALKAERIRTPLTIGRDPLTFVLNTQQSGLLYVLLWDKATARVSQIFPNDLDRNNRIAAGKPLAFPRPDWAYEADQPKGDWEVLAIVSDTPRDFSGLRFETHEGSFGALKPAIETALGESARGGAALVGEAKCAAGQACSPSYAAVRFTVEEVAAAKESAKPAPPKEKEKPAEKAVARDNRNEQAEKKYVKDLNKSLDQLLNEK